MKGCLFCVLIMLFFLFGYMEAVPSIGESIHVDLIRSNNNGFGGWHPFVSEKAWVEKMVREYAVKLPADMTGSFVALQRNSLLFALMRSIPGKTAYSVVLDANANLDLTDDPEIELNLTGMKEWKRIEVKRSYAVSTKHDSLLPCLFALDQEVLSDGSRRPQLNISSDYSFSGKFSYKGKIYRVSLYDGYATGKFFKDNLDGVSIRIQSSDPKDQESSQSWRPLDLLPIGGEFFEFKAIAEDGSWIELGKSDIPRVSLGAPTPDMTLTDTVGKSFKLSDYRGRVLLLDFWQSWCKICVAEFTEIRKTAQTYGSKGLAVISINTDRPEEVAAAVKVIESYRLDWRQVVPGQGEALPMRQVFSQLAENPHGYPLYLIIDESGTMAYATNDFDNVERFLENCYAEPGKKRDSLFIPIVRKTKLEKNIHLRVAFDSAKVESFLSGRTVKMGDGFKKDFLGLLPDGALVLVGLETNSGKRMLVADSNCNLDFTDDDSVEVPIVGMDVPNVSDTVDVTVRRRLKNGGLVFFSYRFFARPTGSDEVPVLFFLGTDACYAGCFTVGGKNYRIAWTDPSGDEVPTVEEIGQPGVLQLFIRDGEDWKLIANGVAKIPIGGAFYRPIFLSESGNLLELEKEK